MKELEPKNWKLSGSYSDDRTYLLETLQLSWLALSNFMHHRFSCTSNSPQFSEFLHPQIETEDSFLQRWNRANLWSHPPLAGGIGGGGGDITEETKTKLSQSYKGRVLS